VVEREPTYKEFVQNMEIKMRDEEFLTDVVPLLRPDVAYNAAEAYDLVYKLLIDRLPGKRE